jgi:hypothetical protein
MEVFQKIYCVGKIIKFIQFLPLLVSIFVVLLSELKEITENYTG